MANPVDLSAQGAHPAAPGRTVTEALIERFGIDAAEVDRQLSSQQKAIDSLDSIQQQLGRAFGGAWYDSDRQRLVVAITDGRRASEVARAGAHAIVVRHSDTDLQELFDRIVTETALRGWSAAVTSISIDPQRNGLRIDALRTRLGWLTKQLTAQHFDLDVISLHPVDGYAEFMAPFHGGDGYSSAQPNLCTIGFGVVGGFLTAGHCGYTGNTVSSSVVGTFAASTMVPFPEPCSPPEPGVPGSTDACPNRDQAWVATTSNWTPTSLVAPNSANPRKIVGHLNPMVGLWVCRYGRATLGWHCGSVTTTTAVQYFYQQNNVRIPVLPLIGANICSAPTDSGGPLIRPAKFGENAVDFAYAVGTLSARANSSPPNCPSSTNSLTYYSPVATALSTWNLSLIRSGTK